MYFNKWGIIEGLDDKSEVEKDTSKRISVLEFLRPIKISCPITIEKVLSKDSRFITDEDIEQLLIKIKKSEESKILITHGTISMVDTAKFLG